MDRLEVAYLVFGMPENWPKKNRRRILVTLRSNSLETEMKINMDELGDKEEILTTKTWQRLVSYGRVYFHFDCVKYVEKNKLKSIDGQTELFRGKDSCTMAHDDSIDANRAIDSILTTISMIKTLFYLLFIFRKWAIHRNSFWWWQIS